MAMNVGPSSSEEQAAISTINTTPLVDVMLVLLIIFLITSQIILQSVKIELPKAVNIPTQTKPENITVAVDKEGNIFWNDGRVANREDLIAHVKAVAVLKPQPEIHLRADKETRYEAVGRVMYAIQRGGVVKVGFLTEPDRGLRVAAR
jgi:biopolymer transport protein ExbD